MSDRYKPLFALKPNGYTPGVPVLISAGQLWWDNISGRPCVQLKLQSLSPKVLQSVSVQIDAKNFTGETIESEVHSFNSLNVARDQFFGDQELIPLNNTSAASFSVMVAAAALYDGTAMFPDEQTVMQLPEFIPLRKALNDDVELEKQYQKENGKNHAYAPVELSDIWRCSCGAVNSNAEQICHSCRSTYEAVMHPNITDLAIRKAERVREEGEKKKRLKKKAQQAFTIGAAIAAAAAVIAALIILLIVPAARYNKAAKAFASGDYGSAYTLYKKNGSFKDSDIKADDAKKHFWASEYNNILTEGYYDYEYEQLFTGSDVMGPDSVFALAYVDYDDIPELLVSPYGNDCYMFSVSVDYMDEDYIRNARLVNTWLYMNPDYDYEIGYFENNGYVYNYSHTYDMDGYGYSSKQWLPFDEREGVDNVKFYSDTTEYTYFDDYTEYYVMNYDDSAEYYEEQDFYDMLHGYVDEGTYKTFKLFKNTESNRSKKLNIQGKSA